MRRIPSGTIDQVLYFVAVDSTDYKTLKTALSSFTVYRSRDGGTATAYTTPTVTEVDATNMPGVYKLLIDEDTTITAGNTSEEVVLRITQAAMAPVTLIFEVFRPIITEGTTLTVTSGVATANTTQIAGSAVSTSTAQIGVNVVNAGATAWGSGAITAASIAADAITAAKVAADVSAEIAAAVWNEATTGHQTASTFGRELTVGGGVLVDTTITGTPTSTTVVLSSGSAVDNFYNDKTLHITSGTGLGQARTILSYVGSTKTITVDEAFATTPAAADGIVILSNHVHPKSQIAGAIWDEAQSGHTTAGTFGRYLDAQVANVETDTQDIQSRLPAALVSGRIDADVGAISTSTAAADNLEAGALGIVSSTCSTGSTTTSVVTNLTEATTDHYKDKVIVFTSGALAGQAKKVTAYNGTTKALTVDTLTEAPANTDAFVLV